MFLYHYGFTFFLFILSCIISNNSFAQSCEDCGKRTVGIYDAAFSFQFPPSVTEEEKKEIIRLLRVSDDISFAIDSNDPKRSCLNMFSMYLKASDSDTMNWKSTQSGGSDWTILPPNGPIKSLDYLIESSLEGNEGNYRLTISLQAAYSREVVVSSSQTFSHLENIVDEINGIISNSFIPVFDKIYQWEIKKRDSDPDIAIHPSEIQIVPSKEEVDINEEVRIDFLLLDCDKKPLKNKKIYLNGVNAFGFIFEGPHLGKFLEDSIYTNEEGKAKATFKAGEIPGMSDFQVIATYKTPKGYMDMVDGVSVIYIKELPSDLWKLSVTINSCYFSVRDTSWRDYLGGQSYSGLLSTITNKSAHAEAKGFIQNASNEEGVFYYADDVPIIAPAATGGFSDISIANEVNYINGQTVSGEKRMDVYTGQAIPNSLNFQFLHNEKTEEVYFGAQVSYSGAGEYYGQLYNGGWKDIHEDVDDYGFLVSSGWSKGQLNGVIHKTSTDGGFIGASYHDSVYKKATYTGTLSLVEHHDISFSLHPYTPSFTSVRENNNINVKDYSLSQNYPNPFNPGTVIGYTIGIRQFVSLKIYDIMGREIAVLVNEEKPSGFYTVNFNAANLASGIYYYQLKTNNFIETKKLILMK